MFVSDMYKIYQVKCSECNLSVPKMLINKLTPAKAYTNINICCFILKQVKFQKSKAVNYRLKTFVFFLQAILVAMSIRLFTNTR